MRLILQGFYILQVEFTIRKNNHISPNQEVGQKLV